MSAIWKWILFSLKLTCTLWCSQCVLDVSLEYFRYKEKILFSIEMPVYGEMPGITFQIFNFDLVYKRFRVKDMRQIVRHVLASNITARQLFEIMFISCEVDLSGNGILRPCSNITNITMLASGAKLQLSLFNRDTIASESIMYAYRATAPLVTFKMVNSTTEIINFLFHSPQRNSDKELYASYRYPGQRTTAVLHAITRRLQSPFPSNCIDFNTLGYFSYADCHALCVDSVTSRKSAQTQSKSLRSSATPNDYKTWKESF